MKHRFILFQRSGIFYCEDTTTGKQTSLRTRAKADAVRLLHVKNEALLAAQCLNQAQNYFGDLYRRWKARLGKPKEGAGALQDLAAQPKHLGAELGVTAMLQTWTRDLPYHPHVHLRVPGGGLTADQLRWRRVQDPQFFLPQVKLAARFKGRLKAWLQADEPALFQAVPAKEWWVKWVADVQPVGSGEAALKYLANYLCRPPLHESQLERWAAQHVSFRYRANGGEGKRATVSATEFVRRFLLHVLPKGFQRVRHYGRLGAAAQAKRDRIAALLDWRAPARVTPWPLPPPQCPGCGQAMRLIGSVARKPP